MQSTVCLNMIVKNESHIIQETLEMLCSKIQFKYWVICDTGSTDDTREIIIKFFKEKRILGELHCDEWVDFAHNRTLALERAFNKTDLLLVFDADDELHGTIHIPDKVEHDEYHLKFGQPNSGMNYTRTQLINNRKRFKYFSVLHEYISCQEPTPARICILGGDYYLISGRRGARNNDPNKYLNDATILAKAHAESLTKGDDLYKRYAFYCANSYRDCGKYEDAIKWYKTTLSQDNWSQEKYLACLYMYQCYDALKQPHDGFFYLVKAFSYDSERVECLYPLLVHYCCEEMHEMAYNYYRMVKMPITQNNAGKLFVETDKAGFLVPYYMIIVADRVQDRECGIRMYEIIFKTKHRTFSAWHLRNLMFNLRFFIEHVKPEAVNAFAALANDYLKFVIDNGVPASTFDGLALNVNPRPVVTQGKIKSKTCKKSRNILFYTGYCNAEWNYSQMKVGALGGSEKAVAYLSKELGQLLKAANGYTVYVAGQVRAEELAEFNVKYVGLNDLPDLLSKTEFHTVICSRYISFLEIYGSACSFYQFYIWAHDTRLLPYGCSMNDVAIIEKWADRIDGCVCQTQWHADQYTALYPALKTKMSIINNGIDLELFPTSQVKQLGKFIYTSRTERGLTRILELWPEIVAALPSATLAVSTYEVFPCNDEERRVQTHIESLNREFPDNRIQHLGKLNPTQLYAEMSTAEYWLYPTNWPETSCITAMEMLMSGVICLYYPVAGLTYTMNGCGMQIFPGSEIQTLVVTAHDEGAKEALRKQGRAYAESCGWATRAQQWESALNLCKHDESAQSILFFLPNWYNVLNLQDYIDGFRTIYRNVIHTSDPVDAIEAINSDPTICKVMFVYEISSEEVYNHCENINNENNGKTRGIIELCLLNTEPLNLKARFQTTLNHLEKHDGIPVYDYSLSNLKILNDAGFKNIHHLPYTIYDEEQNALKMLNAQTEKTHDFGIISCITIVKRRSKVVAFLRANGYTVKVIAGFKHERDAQIASCRILLNIHGSLGDEESKIFEHIRCDRLLAAGYRILSEECLHLNPDFVNAHGGNLKLIPYSAFFETDVIAKCAWFRKKYCFIHSCTFLHHGTAVLDCLVDKINSSGLINELDAVYIINVGIPIEETKYANACSNAKNDGKYILTNYSENERLYENPTLNKLKQFSETNKDSYVLYLHTKGNSYPQVHQEITDWTNMMLYFLVESHEDCFRALDGAHDTVGCNYSAKPVPHYSGNFWWAKTNHIATLPALNENVPDKMAPEFWLFKNNHTACTLHSSGVDHYYQAYPRERYA